MNLYHSYGLFNGSALVAENGKVIYKKGFGLANMDWNIPNTPETRLRIGSITKQFAAMLIMQLVEKGKMLLSQRAAGYLKQAGGYVNEPYFFMQNAYAAGAMHSTVDDLYLWDQALYTDKLLSKKFKEMMFTPYKSNYAYGWGVRKILLKASKDSLLVASHTGGINGFNTIIFRLIDARHLVILFNNTGPARLSEMSQNIAHILYGKPFEPPKKSIAEALMKISAEKNGDAAIAEYRRLKTTQASAYDFGESELNTLGYQLLGLKKVKDAIAIFKLNVEAYPEAFNPYDSLGEAYMINGDKELAIKNYAKSLELNPNNFGAIDMLKRIKEMK